MTLLIAALGATSVAVPGAAAADPPPPANASEALTKLTELNKEAVKLTEEWHNTRDDLDRRRKDQDTAKTQLDQANREAGAARDSIGSYRVEVDKLAAASFDNVGLNPVAALLTSGSPQDFLDRMLLLDIVSSERKDTLEGYRRALQLAETAQRRTEEAGRRAGEAEAQASRLLGELDQRKAEMDRRVASAKAQLDRLSARDRGALTGGGQTNYTVNDIPQGLAQQAMQKALGRQGKPYVWGASGPDTFDCSGLLYWSYRQLGVTLPRSSRDQARVGAAVTRDQLRPGDFVAFYQPVGHIGIYVGDGKMVHAPQGGDTVKVSGVMWGDLVAMRRLG
ncbi:C40 family peptidase [Crossiella cryophila]|uniref:Cell wall-associated NlpC family hydrolase n=1 Tax=Crossiella cryophila TaxID=43355 RepID=A0A7W7FUT6_9PSEU|nr:NlpC/P60 family protein [Crossiella cryophila]MBB4678350.1 cell wall-associated NlpC family hydrolase [Crossiella cryophila]